MPNSSSRRRPFESSEQKNRLRKDYQTRLVQLLYAKVGRPLRYFGLPGEDLSDLTLWRDMIAYVAAVEGDAPIYRSLRTNLATYFSHIRTTTHFGPIDKIIVSNSSRDPSNRQLQQIAQGWSSSGHHRYWDFDIVYLDYCGKFIPEKKRRINSDPIKDRIDALTHLFTKERQDAHQAWLLMITVECRLAGATDRDLLRNLLTQRRLDGNSDTKRALDYCLSSSSDSRYEAARLIQGTLATMIANAASNAGVVVSSRPVIIYQGRNTPMLFFAFEVTPNPVLLGYVPSLPILTIPYFEVTSSSDDIWLTPIGEQPPGLQPQAISRALDFLGSDSHDM